MGIYCNVSISLLRDLCVVSGFSPLPMMIQGCACQRWSLERTVGGNLEESHEINIIGQSYHFKKLIRRDLKISVGVYVCAGIHFGIRIVY